MDSSPQRSVWTYQRLTHPFGVEASDWFGVRSPYLSAHLHDEAQLSVVYSGLRRFRIGGEEFSIPAGRFIVIPAGVPHISVGMGGIKTRSRDVFLKANWFAQERPCDVLLGEAPISLTQMRNAETDVLLDAFAGADVIRKALPLEPTLPAEIVEAVRDGDAPVAKITTEMRLSREGFIRKFAREMGMTPYAFRLAHKASRARAMLRRDCAPAAAAHDAGFSDQSHLGRIFRRTFGTTPAAYARVWRAR
ncbi:MAG: helix-turn-helix transcriptional regulator [Hyphomicrobiaceae bacterium]|nr:helix-turn-helix transcriptional regulator [Hyphomicrobiaceae bacterium]